MGILLWPLFKLYQLVMYFRNLCFDRGIRSIARLSRPVISVGNLSMGGTGKSPVTAELTDLLQKRGYKVAILSRGYGRLEPQSTRRVEAGGDWRLCGDEPLMIARRHPQAIVCVGPTRAAAAALAARENPDIYILDDGFQHRQLARDLDIVLIDVTRPMPGFYSTTLFREHWGALKRAHAVFLTRWDGQMDLGPWIKNIHRVNPNLPVLPSGFQKDELRFPQAGKTQSVEVLRGRRIAAWSGIANPRAFFDDLRNLGAKLEYELALKDHLPLTEKQRKLVISQCHTRQIGWVVTTEKDAVKLEKSIDSDIILASLSISVKWMDETQIKKLLDQIPMKGLKL